MDSFSHLTKSLPLSSAALSLKLLFRAVFWICGIRVMGKVNPVWNFRMFATLENPCFNVALDILADAILNCFEKLTE